MKESELIKKMGPISSKLKESDIVHKCYHLARTLGEGNTNQQRFNTSVAYDYDQDSLLIKLNDGLGQMGGGEIKVFYEDKEVLYGNKHAVDKKENKFHPQINGFCILTYHPGGWENQVKTLYSKIREIKKSPKKEMPKEVLVDEKVLKNIQSNFDGF